jgi:8-oxo-dGTP pyrophosphatase MutT (NUDIX family)
MWQDFSSRFELIEAAGGVVLNSQGEVLWIKRNDKWDLPKGKVEEGELVEETAVREVEEECAIMGIDRGELLGITYHTYEMKGVKVLKNTYWYAMSCSQAQNLKPQIEEGITEVIWASKEKHAECALDTYTSIVELLKREKVLRHLDF